jgi:hypothetical protein
MGEAHDDLMVHVAVANAVLNKWVLLLLESVVIAGYYAWFGFFDKIIGGEGADEAAWEANYGGMRVTVFGLWVRNTCHLHQCCIGQQ